MQQCVILKYKKGSNRQNWIVRNECNRKAKSQTAELKEALGLNKDQEKKVYDINLESNKNMAKMREEMSGGGGGFEGMREKFAKMREEQDKKMKAILTEAQWGKYEKYQEERRSRRGQGRN